MKKLFWMVAVLCPILLSGCAMVKERAYAYGITNSMSLSGSDALQIMSYIEGKVSFEPILVTSDNASEADAIAFNEFERRIAEVDDEELSAMFSGDDYYELAVERELGDGNVLRLSSKRWPVKP